MKKGFTLTELLGVIILLGVIALIAVPIVNTALNNSKIKAYNAQVSTIIGAAKKWGVDNNDLLPLDDSTVYSLTLSSLISSNYLPDDSILDPRDNSTMNGCVFISYSTATLKYAYVYSDTCSQ